AFVRVNRTTLDFGLFPEVSVVPKEVAKDCKFSTIIFGPNIKKIEAGAFVYCDSIRWVYIPKEVEEIGHFIRRPRIPYTIVTQQGSSADAYAKKYGIDVRYVDGVDEFKRITQEIPEEMEELWLLPFYLVRVMVKKLRYSKLVREQTFLRITRSV